MTDLNRYKLFRQTNEFDEVKQTVDNLHTVFHEEFELYPEVASDGEISILNSIKFEDIERKTTIGPEEKISYSYERPSIRVWVSVEFEPATDSEPRGDNIIGVTSRVVLRDTRETFVFRISPSGV